MREINIGPNEKEQRLDRFLMKYLNDSTRSNIYKMLRKKTIKVNNKKQNEKYFLQEGDLVQLYLSEETLATLIKVEQKQYRPEARLDIVFEDDEILVVNKPKGLLTHPDKSEYKNTLSTYVNFYLESYATRTFKPASIQRLDKNTSGLVIFCKTYDSLKKYNEIMRERKINKYYECIVHGNVLKNGEISGYILKDRESNKVKLSKNEMGKDSKFVKTIYKPLKSFGEFTLIEVELVTGRAHQIRASMAYLNHPIVGDTKYGGKKVKGVTTQLLHAYRVEVDGKNIEKHSVEIEEFISKY